MKIKLLNEYAKIPTRATEYSAGYDLYAALPPEESRVIHSHSTELIPTGIALEIPDGFFGAVFPRSGLAIKKQLRLANCVAVIDSDYRGELLVPLHNDADEDFHIEQDSFTTIKGGERIAQLVLLPYGTTVFEPVDELSDTMRGEGGFGSTGN